MLPPVNPEKGQTVLVPLCGKSKDLFWLHGLNLHVHGVELHDQTIGIFFAENEVLPLIKTQDQDFAHYGRKYRHQLCRLLSAQRKLYLQFHLR